MTKLDISLIAKLRKITGMSLLECKKILSQEKGNIDSSVRSIQKSINLIAREKIKNSATQGIVLAESSEDNRFGVVTEINCETDFVSNHDEFREFGKSIIEFILKEKVSYLKIIKEKFDLDRTSLIAKTGENIQISRLSTINDTYVQSYTHRSKIGVVVSFSKRIEKEKAKQIAMHIAACKPRYIRKIDISREKLEEIYKEQMEIASNLKRSKGISEKIKLERIKELIKRSCLLEQDFIINQNKKVGKFMEEEGAEINKFVYFALGNE